MKHAPHIVITSVLLAACSSPAVWDKPGAVEATRKDDLDACHAKAMTAPQLRPATPGSAYGSTMGLPVDESRATNERLAFDDCMAGKGYGVKR